MHFKNAQNHTYYFKQRKCGTFLPKRGVWLVGLFSCEKDHNKSCLILFTFFKSEFQKHKNDKHFT